MWQGILDWIKNNQVGDLSSLAGVLISIFGFFATFVGVLKSKNAARRAEDAANSAKESIRLFDLVVDFSAAIAILEEIKRAHRQGDVFSLPDRYAAIKKLLLTIIATKIEISDEQRNVVHEAAKYITRMERQIEKKISANEKIDLIKFNGKVTENLDNLIKILAEIRSKTTRN